MQIIVCIAGRESTHQTWGHAYPAIGSNSTNIKERNSKMIVRMCVTVSPAAEAT